MRPMTHKEIRATLPIASQKPWRALISVLLAVTVLLASLHHLSCLGEEEGSGPASAISFAFEKSAPPVNSGQCPPGHCHCVCHVSVQALADSVSNPVEFRDPGYGLNAAHLPRLLGALPPFEPPRA
jgi:hypothetical protein